MNARPTDAELWSPPVDALVEAGFSTVSRNPSDHETVLAYRTAIHLALAGSTAASRAALHEVWGWISSWSPDFTQDEEWAATAARVRAALLEPAAPFWNTDMAAAPQDGRLILLTTGTHTGVARWTVVASRDTLNDAHTGAGPVAVFAREYGWHSPNNKHLATAKPLAWAYIPPLTPEESAT